MKSLAGLLRNDLAPGILLLLCAAIALGASNSAASDTYLSAIKFPLALPLPGALAALHLPSTLQLWVNDLLMAIFFFVVGCEIKRELLIGELSSKAKAMLPAAGALGGMLLPALIFSALNTSGEPSKGWGIPMATDIAFSLGVISLLGKRITPSIKVFLTALAIVDDLGAVLVIALFYTASLHPLPLLLGLALMLPLWLLRRRGTSSILPYLGIGTLLWVLFLEAGIHPTVAGVILALNIPLDRSKHLVHALHPVVNFFIMPVFALVNAAEHFEGSLFDSLVHPVGMGVMLGLFLGKPLGITLFSICAIRLKLAALPTGSSYRELFGVAWIAGIGFTMSLFISSLAFVSPELHAVSKLGILIGSLLSAICGLLYLYFFDE